MFNARSYKAIGQLIVTAGSKGTTQDPALQPPTPVDGKFVEPQVTRRALLLIVQCALHIDVCVMQWWWCTAAGGGGGGGDGIKLRGAWI